MSPTTPRLAVLLLDALGTLVELSPPAPLLAEVLAERFGVRVSEDEAARAIAGEIAYYREHLDEGRDPTTLRALRSRCAEALRAALPQRDGVGQIANEALTDALLASLRFKAFADVCPGIRAARERGLEVVVVSNWDISLHELLGRLEIAQLLDGIVTSAEVGYRKPSPEIFASALSLSGADPGAAVHVGDSLGEDVVGARAAGIQPILLARDGQPGPPGVRTIGSLAELAGALT